MTLGFRNFPAPLDNRELFTDHPEVRKLSGRAWLNGRQLSPDEIYELIMKGSKISLKEADALTRALGDDAFFHEWQKARGMGDLPPPQHFVITKTIDPHIRPAYLALCSVLLRTSRVTPKAIYDKLLLGKGRVTLSAVQSLEMPRPNIDFDIILAISTIIGWVPRTMVEYLCELPGYVEPMVRAIEILVGSNLITTDASIASQLIRILDPHVPMELEEGALRRWLSGRGPLDTYLATTLNAALKLPFGAFPWSVPADTDPKKRWALPDKSRKATMDDFAYLFPPIRPTLAADYAFSPEDIWINFLGSEERAGEIYIARGGFRVNDLVRISRIIGRPPVWAGLTISPKKKRSDTELAYLERFLAQFSTGMGKDVEDPKKFLLTLAYGEGAEDLSEGHVIDVLFGKAKLTVEAAQKLERWLGVPYGKLAANQPAQDLGANVKAQARSSIEPLTHINGEDGSPVELSEFAANIVRFVTFALAKEKMASSGDIVSDFSSFLRVKSGMPFTTTIVTSWLEEKASISVAEMQLICALFKCTPKQLVGPERAEAYVFKKESVEVCKGRLMNKYATLLTLKQHSKGVPFFTYKGKDNESFIARLQLAFYASENAVSAKIKPAVIAKKLQYLCGPAIKLDDPWVNGEGIPSGEVIDRIANVLHIDAGWLAGTTPEIGFYRDAMRRQA